MLDIGQSILADSGTWFRNLQLLGTGGSAVTFLVVATSGSVRGVPFALKIFRRLAKPERKDSFLEEVGFLETCDHPSVMRVFDSGTFRNAHPFVVAEYLPRTLAAIIRSGNATTVEKVSYTLQLLSALDYLSSLTEPVIHRDIKPENIFVKGKSCVLGDFGLMKRMPAEDDSDRELFKESIGPGMPFRYRTPDLVAYLRGEASISPKSDVFQLGLVVAELFTGRNPAKWAEEFHDPIELEDLATIPGALSAGIANLIRRMLIIDADDRDSADRFIDPWQGVFLEAVKRSHALEGRVF